MATPSANPLTTTAFLRGEFFVTGGTLRPDAPSYVERQADKELREGLLAGEFCYVLTSRQMGKSSLMVRTVKRLRQEGAAVAVLDLTAIGQNLTIDQWYDGLMSRLGQQLDLEDEIADYWGAHPELGPLQRWIGCIESVVLQRLSSRVVIFVDEIDIVRSLPFSTDEFFAAIREIYNRRAREMAFSRLAFGLLGVAAPTDLIRDTRMTPFNIGRRIELNDFTAEEAAPLAQGLGADETALHLLSRVLFWTGGHPYLTQRLCRALAETVHAYQAQHTASTPAVPPVIPTHRTVDKLAEKLFLSRQARDRDDNLIFVRERILRSEVDVPGLLYLYRKILNGQPVPDDETNQLVTVLRLSGIVRGIEGTLRVRNRIYAHVFDQGWTQTNMPDAEVRRQRRASRKGVMVGLSIAVVLVVGYVLLGPVITRQRQVRLAQSTAAGISALYRNLQGYQDTYETTAEIGIGGVTVPVTGSGSLLFEKPDMVNLVVKTALTSPESELRVVSDRSRTWLYAPALKQYEIMPPGPPSKPLIAMGLPGKEIGPFHVLPLYRMFLIGNTADRFPREAQHITYTGYEEVDGTPATVIKWEHDAESLLAGLRITNATPGSPKIPVTAWVSRSENLVLRIKVDLSAWAGQLVSGARDVPLTGLVITETHRGKVRPPSEAAAARFTFEPPADVVPVHRLRLPTPDLSALSSAKRQFARFIPPRLAQATPDLIDLSEYYNASLALGWHPGMDKNDLASLPTGILQLGGRVFDVRGIIQLSGRNLARAGGRYPERINGVRIRQNCRQLHFLHASGWTTHDGTRIGTYVVRWADGKQEEIPILYGQDVRDWNADSDGKPVERAKLAWSGMNEAKRRLRLFMTTWENPYPETQIFSIDYVSTMADAAPFLVAISAE